MVKKYRFHSPLFDLKIRQAQKATIIDMQLHGPIINTYDLPQTLYFLQVNYPRVLNTQCFNDNNRPFEIEVMQTEIGHLFEHILIDNLCDLKIKRGASSAVFNGLTSWNWKENPLGSFQIWVDIGRKDLELFIEALRITINLMKKLMQPELLTTNLRAITLDHPQKII